MSLRSRSKNLSLGKIGFLPTKCPQWCPHPCHIWEEAYSEQWDENLA